MLRPDKYETGSSGFVWKNRFPDPIWSQLRLHFYTAHEMQIGQEWKGSEFVNHYNRIYYIIDGEAELVLKDKTIIMQPNFLYLIPPYQLVSHRTSQQLHFYWSHFQAHLDNELDFYMLYEEAQEFDCTQYPDIADAFLQLIALNNNESTAAIFQRQGLLFRLLQPYFDHYDKKGQSDATFKYQSLFTAINRINEDISSPPSIKLLAELSNLSVEHFSRKFKAAFNISPKRYILARQISHAKQLLLASHERIESVAEHCGFGDIYHFSKTFKQETGTTPSQFRKGYTNQHKNVIILTG